MTRKTIAILFIVLYIVTYSATAKELIIEPYSNMQGQDLSDQDFKDQLDLLLTLSFDKETIWPPQERMPENFASKALLELGKEPGLGIREL